MSNRIDIIVTEAPQVDANTPPLDRSNLTDDMVDFEWTIAAQGGFKTASIELVTTRNRAFDILARFISKRVAFTTPTALHPSQIAWEGMVYTVTVDDGKRSITRSMANVYNRIEVVYSGTDYTQAEPQGSQVQSITVNDTASQALYGLRHMVYQVGEMSVTDANRFASVLLKRYAYPQTVQSGEAIGGVPNNGGARVSIGCVGYSETLDKYIYKDPIIANQTLDNLIKSVINTFAVAGPTTIIKTDYANVVANAFTRPQWQDKNITAADYIADICAYGSGTTTEQNFFGVLEDRTIYYKPFPTTPAYWMSVFDQSERIWDAVGGGVVDPWNVRPGQIVSIGDLLPPGPAYSADTLAVQSFVIGEVEFKAPNKVRLIPWTGDPTQVTLNRIAGGLADGNLTGVKVFEGNEQLKLGDRLRSFFVGRDEVVWRAADVYSSVAQSIPGAGVFTAITFNSVRNDTDGMWNAGTPTRLTVKVSGWYVCSGHCLIGPDAAGANIQRLIAIRVNGASVAVNNTGTINAVTSSYMSVARVIYLNSDDYVELWVAQAGAGAINTVVTNYSPVLAVARYP